MAGTLKDMQDYNKKYGSIKDPTAWATEMNAKTDVILTPVDNPKADVFLVNSGSKNFYKIGARETHPKLDTLTNYTGILGAYVGLNDVIKDLLPEVSKEDLERWGMYDKELIDKMPNGTVRNKSEIQADAEGKKFRNIVRFGSFGTQIFFLILVVFIFFRITR